MELTMNERGQLRDREEKIKSAKEMIPDASR